MADIDVEDLRKTHCFWCKALFHPFVSTNNFLNWIICSCRYENPEQVEIINCFQWLLWVRSPSWWEISACPWNGIPGILRLWSHVPGSRVGDPIVSCFHHFVLLHLVLVSKVRVGMGEIFNGVHDNDIHSVSGLFFLVARKTNSVFACSERKISCSQLRIIRRYGSR